MRSFSGFAIAFLCVASTRAAADTISFGDYFFPGDSLANGFASVTDGHASFVVAGPGTGFTVETQGGAWMGQFIRNTTLIYDNAAAGDVTIDFGTPVDSIGELAVQPRDFGAYTATLIAYAGTSVVGSSTVSGFNAPGTEGTISYLSVTGAGITSIALSSTNDGDGIAIGGGLGIPEAPSWLMLLSGFALIGAKIRRQTTAHQAA